MSRRIRLVFLLAPLLTTFGAAASIVESLHLQVGRFSIGDIVGWQHELFSGETRYRLNSVDGRMVMSAQSDASASGYYREISVDLTRTPILNWSWRAQQLVRPDDEKEKAGDDFTARIYVVRKGGWWFWNTRVINYVWSFQHARGDAWDSPVAGERARMLAVRDRDDNTQTWYHEKRNIVEDFRNQFGIDVDSIDAIAIMTDSDNTGQSAAADYGDIFFTAE